MKKALTRTIIVFVAVSLMTAGFAFAQNDPNEASREETLAAQKKAETEIAAKVAKKEAEIAAKMAQKEAEIAHKQMEAAAKEMQVAQEQMVVAEKQMQDQQSLLQDLREMVEMPSISNIRMPGWQHSGSGSVLVVPAAQMKAENLATITEDMSVMSRIFDTKLNQARLTTARGGLFIGFNHLVGHNSGAIEAIYIEGYGALFLMKVNALLSPPSQVQQEEKTEEDADPLWTRMRQQMYEPEKVDRRRRTKQPEEKYDPEKVKDLKETLIKTLKHAANIRALKPDDLVVLTVIGKAGRSDSLVTRVYSSGDSRHITTVSGGAKTGFSSPTVLTIRAKKSYIDAFAQNKVDFDQFREKIQLISYSCLGENLSRGSSPSSWPGATTGVDSYSDYSAESSSRRPGSRSSGVGVTTGERSSNRRRVR